MLSKLLCVLEDSGKDVGRFQGLDSRRVGGEKAAEGMMLNFAESGHLVFRASCVSERGELQKEKETS